MAAMPAVPVHVVLPASILDCSPSLQDGVTPNTERLHRFFGCELIQEAGILLRLPQVVMATAQTTLQRFYYRKSLRTFDAFRVASACLFVAAKAEEQPKRIRDVLSVFYALYKRRKWHRTLPHQQLLDVDSSTYSIWRDWLIRIERQILIDVGFSLDNVMEHPHKYILYYIKLVNGSNALAQRAWSYVNDSLRTDVCVRYRSELIASAALFVASRTLQIKLPDAPQWYELLGVERRELVDASIALMAVYQIRETTTTHEASVQWWVEPLTDVNPFTVDDTVEEEKEEEEVVVVVEQAAVEGGEDDRKLEEKNEASPIGPDSTSIEAASVVTVETTAVVTGSERMEQPNRAAESSHRRDREERRGRRTPSPSRSRSRSRDRQHRRERSRSSERRSRRRSRSRSQSRLTDRHRRTSSSSNARSRRHRSRSQERRSRWDR